MAKISELNALVAAKLYERFPRLQGYVTVDTHVDSLPGLAIVCLATVSVGSWENYGTCADELTRMAKYYIHNIDSFMLSGLQWDIGDGDDQHAVTQASSWEYFLWVRALNIRQEA